MKNNSTVIGIERCGDVTTSTFLSFSLDNTILKHVQASLIHRFFKYEAKTQKGIRGGKTQCTK